MPELERLKDVSSLETFAFDAVVLTPLLMHGWQKPGDRGRGTPLQAELRVPSLKGVLRYWWRTLQVDIEPKQLLQKEQSLFGGSAGNEEDTRQSPLILKCSRMEERIKTAAVCPHKNQRGGFSTAIPAQTKFSIELAVKIKDRDKLGQYIFYMRYCLLLGAFGQRSRRGAGAVQCNGFQWKTTAELKESLHNTLASLGVAGDFNLNPGNKHCLLERSRGDSQHPRILSLWLGKPFARAEEVRTALSKAGHAANPTGRPQLLGTTKGGRQASPLLGTVRKIGEQYYPLVTEVSSSSMGKSKYQEQRNLFLRSVGVSI